ncbi:GntR family transcriptional regulator [Rhodococcoides trifolii]|uniref:GntR family transcriptional regulator n=1 Tax=Rhodococcoides trifolii TaxID=908250 RepID=A0A917D6N4_9NOCA|nr:PLP-dependent aminotransferase family protein [Rhodococcus trifolii]GGG12289.1 GntR family transcriptional regulator [Rhodococcus trifolii]
MSTVIPNHISSMSAGRLADALGAPTLEASSRASGSPLYAHLASELRRLVETGVLSSGTRLPAERALSASLGVSRVTVASAYRDLRDAGLLRSQQGAGTFVAPTARESWGSLSRHNGSGVLEFVNASPSASPLLHEAYLHAVERVRDRLPDSGYAPGGSVELKESVAAYYTRRGLPTSTSNILITCGASDAAHAILDTLIEPGGRVLVEHPTYPGVVDAVASTGGRCIPVSVDPDDPDGFVAAADLAARQSAPTLAYFMPDFSNPSGTRLPVDSRRRLSATMHRHGVLTVVDEVSADLGLDDSPALEPFGVATPARATITLGSTSKTVWGGIRVGWVRAEPSMIDRIASTYARRQLSASILDQTVAALLLDHYDEVCGARSQSLRAARDHLAASVREMLPDWSFRLPAGGLSLWCRLPTDLRSTDLVAAAHARGVLLAPGPRFGLGHAFDDHQRIPFTRALADITDAVAVLADITAAQSLSVDSAPRRPSVVV